LQRNPSSAVAAGELGLVNRQLGKFADAEQAYRHALELDPNAGRTHRNFGVLLDLYLQKPAEALREYQSSLELLGGEDKQISAWIAELKQRLGGGQKSARAEAANDQFPTGLISLGLAVAGTGLALADDPPADSKQAARAASAAVRDAEPVAGAVPPAAASRRVPAAARTPSKPPAYAAAAAKSAKALDRLELDPTQITGNRELPKVMVIVPWKRSDIGDLIGRPVNSLVDEALQPLDRGVFRREIDYYKALSPDQPRSETQVTGGAPSDRPEK
jgi:tetratricopeptide (TPR) repeat protein